VSEFDLRGKDYFTEAEAAHYCGVSLRQFQDHSRQFRARRHLGKKLYSRAELADSIERADPWLHSTNVETPSISNGARTASNGGARSERLNPVRLRKYVKRKKPSLPLASGQ